eukprot:6203882-Pleurochrysis_carterae.AAC.1
MGSVHAFKPASTRDKRNLVTLDACSGKIKSVAVAEESSSPPPSPTSSCRYVRILGVAGDTSVAIARVGGDYA